MHHLMGFALTVLLGLFWGQVHAQPSEPRAYSITGEAYRLGASEEQIVYREKYTPVLGGQGLGIVDYFDAEDRLIATKALDYGPGENSPSFTMYDLRRNWFWSVQVQGEELLLSKGAAGDLEQKTIQAQEPQVVDAGFDTYISNRLDQLKSGEQLSFYSAVPARLNNYRLKAESIDYSQSPISRGDPDWSYVKVQVANPLFAFFADALYLAYEADAGRLKVYRGRTGLTDADGKPQDVEIYYHYH